MTTSLARITHKRSATLAVALAALGSASSWIPGATAQTERQIDTTAAHLEAALLLQTLNADLLSHDSATLTLERWCADQRLAPSARIVVERVRGAEKPPTEEQRAQLAIKE